MKKLFLLITIPVFLASYSNAQNRNTRAQETDEGYKFTPVIDLKTTSVKNQAATGTCWCFATTSFIETELLRMGKGEYDLSEMFVVRMNYIDRLKDNYLRRGKGNLGPGSLSHDWMRVFSNYGILPDEVYNGLNYGSPTHNHSELQAFINAVAAVPVERRNESKQYEAIVNAVLDTYLGKVPETFTYKGTSYTPKTFAASLGINPDDYVQITSFTHFPFYTRGILEVPDNWSMERFYNVPLDELIEIIDYAFSKGFSVNWDGDVSESGFSHQNGYAVLSANPVQARGAMTDRQRLERAPTQQARPAAPAVQSPGPELNVTQELRQTGYESFSTTDDHLMHLTGVFKDQNGTKYYKTKNSWGTDRNAFGGFLNMSESYVRAKTLFIMVHKDAVPPAVRTKLGI
ncbi:MAG TPA: C1 family peptidase [Bacteroidales bacterium]|nr:C1 family peptidase [Bacteroidales bacterium]HPJ59188.1 C1 family peptidase [Bacteroidales bacterium]HPR11811.1 C1 family peptidase [Bacteroidales bacterium]HRW84040.1 C1 family peptidase [Bacteroidales bacterium]